jgi:two-component system chemotaxis response regulator CheY
MKRDSLTIMLIDDMTAMRMVMKGILSQIGFTSVIEQSSAPMALNTLNHQPDCCRMVLCDWVMPQMSGFDFLRTVRSHNNEHIKRLPVVMVTAEAARENILQAQMAGVNGYILKPFTPETVEKAIMRLFPDLQA